MVEPFLLEFQHFRVESPKVGSHILVCGDSVRQNTWADWREEEEEMEEEEMEEEVKKK